LEDDIKMRQLGAKPLVNYTRGVSKLCDHLQRSQEDVTAEDLRQFQLHMVLNGVSGSTINATLTALRFLYNITLGMPQVILKLANIPVSRKLITLLHLVAIQARFILFHPNKSGRVKIKG